MKPNNHSTFIQLIADYGTGDPAFGEVIQRLKTLNQNLQIHPTSVPAFSTIATGFWIAQYAKGSQPENFFIYANTAPRKDEKQKRKNNAGEKLVYARLKNGCQVVAVNSGFSFSFLREEISQLHLVKIPNQGSQFRSRDYYPQAVNGIINQEHDLYLGEKIDPLNSIPELPTNRLAFADGYGNMKTTIAKSEIKFKPGDKVKILLNQVKRLGTYASGNFEVKEGELAFAPGSSGKKGEEFLEIFLRGGSAWELFSQPKIESEILFEKV